MLGVMRYLTLCEERLVAAAKKVDFGEQQLGVLVLVQLTICVP